jgi:phenylacetate-CoA ligase
LEERQRQRLAQLLTFAARHVPLYRERWQAVASPVPETAVQLLRSLPLLTKSDVQAHHERLLADPQPRRVMRKITGGSTGQAVTISKDAEAVAAEMAASWLGYGWFGIRIGDRAVRFWGSPHVARRRLRYWAADRAMHRRTFSAFAFSEQDLGRYWRRCLAFRPAYLYGYVSMLEAFATFVAGTGFDGRALGLRAIITTSEVLGEPQRHLLQETFGCPVQNEYGCGELGPIAYSCLAGRLHIMTENLFLEVLTEAGAPAGPGESGEVVVTDLTNRAMPLVRYQLGDFATLGAGCECGRAFPVLERVWGRAYDFVEHPDGRRYHGEFFMYFFEDLRARGIGVDRFQIVQTARTRLEVRVVNAASATDAMVRNIEALLSERLPGMSIAVSAVREISRLPSGKLQLISSPWARADRPQRTDNA